MLQKRCAQCWPERTATPSSSSTSRHQLSDFKGIFRVEGRLDESTSISDFQGTNQPDLPMNIPTSLASNSINYVSGSSGVYGLNKDGASEVVK